jgi:hypothetical protein
MFPYELSRDTVLAINSVLPPDLVLASWAKRKLSRDPESDLACLETRIFTNNLVACNPNPEK